MKNLFKILFISWLSASVLMLIVDHLELDFGLWVYMVLGFVVSILFDED